MVGSTSEKLVRNLEANAAVRYTKSVLVSDQVDIGTYHQ